MVGRAGGNHARRPAGAVVSGAEDRLGASPVTTKKSITVIDVAKAAGVSKSTVSLVLQGNPVVHEATREKVRNAIERLGYVYNRGAANWRRPNSTIIGIVVNDLTNSFFAELAVGMDYVLQSAGYVQLLAHTGEDVARQREVMASMREHGIAGMIISPARGTTVADLKPIISHGIPVVVAIRGVPGAKVSSVLSDNYAGARMGVEHLVGLGHRRIAFLGGFPDIQVFEERRQGYLDALAAAGIDVDPSLVVPSAPSRAGGIAAIDKLFAGGSGRATAAQCFNDAVAFGAMDALRARRLEPGADFCVVGFDDVIEAGSSIPKLTTIAVDPQMIGQRAVGLLLRQITAQRIEVDTFRTPVRLVVRDTTRARVSDTV
jgi:LacI family transcriptional regulator